MPRVERERSEADIYHVIVRGEGRRAFFEDDEDRMTFLRLLVHASDRTNGRILAWCLMTNHVHLVVQVAFDLLPSMMRSLNGGYAGYYNKAHDHVGHVFAGRYKSKPVATDEQLLQLIRYVHFNPVKGGLSRSYDYKWSSYNEYLGKDGIADTSFVLGICGSLQVFKSYHASQEEDAGVMPADSERRRMSESEARLIALDLFGEDGLANLPSLARADRDAAIASLRNAGLSVRQIERLTGIGRGIISRVKCDKGSGTLSRH